MSMKKKSLVQSILIVLGLSLMMVLGCASSPSSRFYTLSPLSSPEMAREVQPLSQGRTIGLGPIRFPDYLERPGIVTRTNGNTLKVAEFDLWAGSLKADFTRVLIENFYLLLKTDKIIRYPYSTAVPPSLRIWMDVSRFEGTLGGQVLLEAGWIILEGEEKKEGFSRISSITEPVNGSDYQSLAAAQSRAVERLSREMAKAIQALPVSSPAK
jgi:uncharacterized lipoprotein YmbA